MLGAARHASYMRHAPCLGAAGAVSLRARAVSSFRTGWSGGRMHGGEAVVYRRERSGREGHRRQSRTGRDAEGRWGLGVCLPRSPPLPPSRHPGRQARPQSPGPSQRLIRPLETRPRGHARAPSTAVGTDGCRRALHTRLSLSPLPLLFLWASATSRDRESTCVEAERGKRRSGGACLQFGVCGSRAFGCGLILTLSPFRRVDRPGMCARERREAKRTVDFENWQRVLG